MTLRERFEKENPGALHLPYLKRLQINIAWLEAQIPIREQQAWDARGEEIPAISGPAGRKYQTIEEWREKR